MIPRQKETMSFQFNFSVHNDSTPSDNIVGNVKNIEQEAETASGNAKDMIATEIFPNVSASILLSEFEVLAICLGVTVNCVRSQSVEERLTATEGDSSIAEIAKKHSDLIPNVYEGGLKVWECSLDLVGFLHEARIPLAGLSVLELGCGAGLPGIYALQQGADHVCFQDFNEEVVEHLTVPNVSLNLENRDLLDRCRFIAGDWGHIGENLIPSNRYDSVLTSETIYSTDSTPSLYELMHRTLKADGVVYVAAKTHYFGVGGGTRLFEDYVRSRGDFTIETCKKWTEGLQREVLLMRRNQPSPR